MSLLRVLLYNSTSTTALTHDCYPFVRLSIYWLCFISSTRRWASWGQGLCLHSMAFSLAPGRVPAYYRGSVNTNWMNDHARVNYVEDGPIRTEWLELLYKIVLDTHLLNFKDFCQNDYCRMVVLEPAFLAIVEEQEQFPVESASSSPPLNHLISGGEHAPLIA